MRRDAGVGRAERSPLRAEVGGPPLAGPPARRGFGSRVLEATLRDQLGGRVERRWVFVGLICDIELPLARVSAGAEPPDKTTGPPSLASTAALVATVRASDAAAG